jgi:hypothetical protein
MATYFVASGGSNTAPYDTWAKAATSLATALAAATTDGDLVVIQYNAVPSGDAELAADTTYTIAGNISIISASNDGGSAWTPTVMTTANWIGNSTTSRSITITGAFKVLFFGLTLRLAGASSKALNLGGGDGIHYLLESCYLWQGNTAANNLAVILGSTGGNSYLRLTNCTIRLGSSANRIRGIQAVDIVGGLISPDGAVPSTLFDAGSGVYLYASGMDLSYATGNLVHVGTSSAVRMTFDRCSLGTGYVPLVAQTPANKSSASVLLLDCAVGDVQGRLQYADAFGLLTSDTGIYFTAGPSTQSWKIETTANCSFATPFITPPIFKYNNALSAITPYLEILRDGSTTAFDNDEVWAEFTAKTNSGTSLASFYSDRMALGGTPAAQANGVGLGSWTGESGTAWSGKIDSGGSLTPAEVGDISAQVCVGLASATVYVDPVIRS